MGAVERASDPDLRAAGFDGLLYELRGRGDLESAFRDAGPRVLFERAQVERAAGADAWTIPAYCAPCRACREMHVDWWYAEAGIPNWRERLVCPGCKLNNRQRFAALVLEAAPPGPVYLQEQVTAFYDWASAHRPEVVGSEYLGDDVPGGTVRDGIRHEDGLALTFPDATFSVMVSNDVLEHVPDAPRALAEAARVLRPGGALIFTIPFHADREETTRRAELRDGELVFVQPPVYHGNPVGDGRSLVFYDYGWDVLRICRDAGFADAHALGYWSALFGHLGGGLQMVFLARR
jgi:SAM-dependent methyltransferase